MRLRGSQHGRIIYFIDFAVRDAREHTSTCNG